MLKNYVETARTSIGTHVGQQESIAKDAQKDRPARPQASRNRRRTLLGYVEDFGEPRTKLADFFSILVEKGS
jgi:hypothetical protein